MTPLLSLMGVEKSPSSCGLNGVERSLMVQARSSVRVISGFKNELECVLA